jgi:hypothetical protein
MAEREGLSSEDLRQVIIENLREIGIDHELIEIKIKKSSRVILRGPVESERIKSLIIETIRDVVGIDDIVDQLVVIEETYDENLHDDDMFEDDRELLDEDNESFGTSDVFRSVEEGLPYIPPTRPRYGDFLEESEKKRSGKKKSGR